MVNTVAFSLDESCFERRGDALYTNQYLHHALFQWWGMVHAEQCCKPYHLFEQHHFILFSPISFRLIGK